MWLNTLWPAALALLLTGANQLTTANVLQSNHVNTICSTWGREHFKTFDGSIYQFPGMCEYNLASDCHSDSYPEFSVHMKRNEAPDTDGNPTVKHLVVTINDLVVTLTKTLVTVNDEIVTLPYYNGGVQVERNAVYTKLLSKVGLVVMWNGEDAVMVELDPEYSNRTCGLCGDYNGIPVRNEFIHNGREVGPIEFGNMQKVHRPNEDCEDPYEEEDKPADVQLKDETCTKFYPECDQLLRSALWSSCGAALNPEPYIQACVQDRCGCRNTSDSFCLCSTLAEYSRQCSHAGGQPPQWRTTTFCEKRCPFNMVHLESGSPCMDTCTHTDTSSMCEEHQMDGCFCPPGTVFDNISERGCIPHDQCQCKHDKVYNPGEIFRQDYEECVCHRGQWSCKSLPSPATCAVEEGSHVKTFDGRTYTFHGNCYYSLAKVEPKDESSPMISIFVQLVPCTKQAYDTCLKSVVVLLNNDKNNALVINADGKVSHNAQITLPYNTADISMFQPSSFHIMLQTSFGLQVQIQLVPVMQVYITLDESYKTKTQGLCGNFNKVLSDDMKSPQGIVEGTAYSFANSWKANPTCTDREDRADDPCSLSVENEKYAKHWCSLLRSTNSTFTKCHAMVDPELYYKRCTYASCNCEKSEDCLCAVFSSYARDCATKGVSLTGWRQNVCDKYTSKCPASQIYSDQLQRCQLTCSSLANERQGCTNNFLPVDGCSCPEGLYMDDSDTCVPMAKCPCFHNGVKIKPGKSININEEHCVCNNGMLHCRSWKIPSRSSTACVPPMVYSNCSDVGVQCTRSCRNPDFLDCFASDCVSGCKCPTHLYEDGKNMCVKKHECPCSHDRKLYVQGSQIQQRCNKCTCMSGKWDCTKNNCSESCTIYGSGHYETFDTRLYGFQGECSYVAVQNKCGAQKQLNNFVVITENVPCGNTGTTCSKIVRIQLGRTELKLHKNTYEVSDLGSGPDIQYEVRTVGLYLVVASNIGITVLWDRKTRIEVVLEPQHRGAVCGLCGNFNGNGEDDFTTNNNMVVSSPVEFANSWKVFSSCPDAEINVDPCGARPNRHTWAKMQCSIIKGDTFKDCHHKVDPNPFVENCVRDSCACDSGGDCECFCTAVAAYAQACNEAGVCVAWRTPEICPVFCDFYNKPDNCTWHYNPCHDPWYKTCKYPSGNYSSPVPHLEGCYPKCPPETPIFNEDTGECVEYCLISTTTTTQQTTTPQQTTSPQPTTTTTTTPVPTTTTPEPTTTTQEPSTTTPVTTTTTQEATTTTQEPSTTTQEPTTTTQEATTTTQEPSTTTQEPTTTTQEATTTTQEPSTTTQEPTTTTQETTTTTQEPTTTTQEPTTTTQEPTTTTPVPTTTTQETTTPTPTPPCIPTCDWSEWYDEDDSKDKSDWETYWNITQSGKTVCNNPLNIECRSTKDPSMSFEDFVSSTNQVVECDVDFGLICEENKQITRPYKCFNYEIRVNCCVECYTTPQTPSTTTETTTKLTTTTPVPTTTTTPVPTTTTAEPTTTTQEPTTTTPVPTTTTAELTTTTQEPTTTTPVTTTTTQEPTTTTQETTTTTQEPTTTTQEPTTTTQETTTSVTTTTTQEPTTTTPVTTTTTQETTTTTQEPTTTTQEPTTTTQETTTPTPTPPCIPTCDWSEWYDEDDSKDKSDWETYWNITQSGKTVCNNPLNIECRSTKDPSMSFEDFVSSTNQVVECDVDFGLICEENKQITRPYKCFNYEIRVNCCVECYTTPQTPSTTTETTTKLTTTTPVPTTTTTPVLTTTTAEPTTTTQEPTTTTQETTTTTQEPTTTTHEPTTTTQEPTTTTPVPTTTTAEPTTTTQEPTTTTPVPTTTTAEPTTTTQEPTTTTQETTTTTQEPTTTTHEPTTTTQEPTTTTPVPTTTTAEPTTTTQEPTTTTPVPTTTTAEPTTTTQEPTTTTPVTTTTTQEPTTTTQETTTTTQETTTTTQEPTTTTQETTTTTQETTTTTPVTTTTTQEPTTTTQETTTTTQETTTTTQEPTTTTQETTTTTQEPTTTTPVTTTTTPVTTTTTQEPTTTTQEPTTTTQETTTTTQEPTTTTQETTTTTQETTTTTQEPTTTTQEPTTTTPVPTTTTAEPTTTTQEPTTTTPVPTTTTAEPTTTTQEPTTTTPVTTTTTQEPTTTTQETTTTTQETTTTTQEPTTTTQETTTTTQEPTTTTPVTTTTTPVTTTQEPTTTTQEPTTTTQETTTTTQEPTTTTQETTTTTQETTTTTQEPTTTTQETTTTTQEPTTTTQETTTTTQETTTTTQETTTTTQETTTTTQEPTTTTQEPTTTTQEPTTTTTTTTTTVSPSPPPITCPEWDKVQNETFWICNCTLARCIENNTIEIIKYPCPTPEPITCANGEKSVLRWDEFYCCKHYVCECVCEGWGDPHYVTFDGLFYSFQGNCTYVLMEEMRPRFNFRIYIDNVYCDPTEDVSCPRAIIVSYGSAIITLKNNNLIGAAKLEASIDGNVLKLPFKQYGIKVMSSGINMVLEIKHLEVIVTFGITGFSVYLPWRLFGNNTQGHCGTCNNNQADDCMLPSGQLLDSCAVMADYWPANDITKPECNAPSVTPTKFPLPEPTLKPCKPDTSVCEILKSSVFAACHPFISPDNFYQGCVYDSCRMSNPAVECTSLQTYAGACAQKGICVHWRNHTTSCVSDCPAGKIYKPCGPAEQPACDDNPDESRVNFTTEGCFCPDGMKLFSKDSGICVNKCGCLDPDNVPREFNERFEYKCQDCVCEESTKTVTCKHMVCPKPPVTTCTGPGFVLVNQTDPSNTCCTTLFCRCDSSTCPTSKMECDVGYLLVVSVPEGKCCPEHTCEPKGVCVHKGTEYLPSSEVPGPGCQTCTCTNVVDPKSSLFKIDCEYLECVKNCEEGFKYQEPDHLSEDCCGKCVQTHCILQLNGTMQLLKHGDVWSAPGEKCQQYNCIKEKGRFLSQRADIHCPLFQQSNCEPGTIQTAANGCCSICIEIDKACKIGSMKTKVSYKGCQSVLDVDMPYCEGSCNTFTKYSEMAASLDHSCSCCKESRISNRTVNLECLNGDIVPYTYIHVEECSCRHSDCPKAIRLPERKRRSHTLV
ncbi:hypothetical protein DPEC_G00159860 [Dallia pectoralis]|uniref:Uncharacterized protein n=1 Tax=Dallia pectoralis TaxID=75939 RepID=A0ACC2GFY3_DALPE|nr:hypothetical protein DPEC_G00159860 [Dallia pectoralis]